jgi:hypothetical protein
LKPRWGILYKLQLAVAASGSLRSSATRCKFIYQNEKPSYIVIAALPDLSILAAL